MALAIQGLWSSWIHKIPVFPPIDGLILIDPPDPSTGDFTGYYHHPDNDFSIRGKYTPAMQGALDKIEFYGEQPVGGQRCKLTYQAYIISIRNTLVTINGTRTKDCGAAERPDVDDWVGTHTT